MSARDGIFHAEGNSADEELRLLQIWIKPKSSGGKPIIKTAELSQPGLNLLAGPTNAPLLIRQDLNLYAAHIQGQEKFNISNEKFGYAVFIGNLKLNGVTVADGDGALLHSGSYTVQGDGQFILIEQEK